MGRANLSTMSGIENFENKLRNEVHAGLEV